MRKRIGIFGATDEALALIPLLLANPGIEIVRIWGGDVERLRGRLPHLDPGIAEVLERSLTGDVEAFRAEPLQAVVDATAQGSFAERVPEAARRGVQIVTPLTARLLWAYEAASGDHKSELLQTLHEVVESYNLTIDADELFTRMLEIAIGVTGAEGGSLMLFDEAGDELRVRVAVGVEPELWSKIRVRLGEGIAGRVAAEGRPLHLRGKADRQRFQIVRERLDVESALSVPLIHDDRILGVLNLHHSSRPEAFTEADLEFTEELARLDAEIIARAQEHEALRLQAARYSATHEVHTAMSGHAPLADRLTALCRFVAERSNGGIATVYLYDADEDVLRLSATSLAGGNLGGEYRVAIGEGVDGAVARTREPAFLHRADGTLAYAALPLAAGDVFSGVLSIQAGGDAPRGSSIEAMLREIATAAAKEIAHVERTTRMATRATKLSAINEAGIRMISTTEPAEVLRLGTSSAAMVLEADHAILRLQDDETRRYVIRSYFGSADGRLQGKIFRLDKKVSVDVLKRRGTVLVRDVLSNERYRGFDAEVRSLIAAPLRREGRAIGTLALYDKIATDRFYTGCFSDEDLELFSKFVSYLERAVVSAQFYDRTRQYRSFDDETGLPNATYLAKRVREEIARNGARSGALALAMVRIDNLDEIERQGDPVKTRRIVQRMVEVLRGRTRDFDVVGRVAASEFAVLIPEPGPDPGEHVYELARSVADDISKEEALNDPVRIALAFGYATYPVDGTDSEGLLARARDPRIRMV
jgi:diguanylate cyclase (GGDEF)-like protein